jgi:hypothetical protein
LVILAGTVGFIYHLTEVNVQAPFTNDAMWVLLVRIVAIVGGVLTLRGANTGRWLLVIWLLYHVVLSYFHTLSELITHATLLAVIAYILFHPRLTAFFKHVKTEPPKS